MVLASRSGLSGMHSWNLGGSAAHMREVVAAIEAVVPAAAGTITFEDKPLPFPDDIDTTGLESLGEVPVTPLADGIRQSAELYRRLLAEGRLVAAEQGLE